MDLEASEPAIEPLILPGESLGKYRQGGEAEQPVARPSNEIVLTPRASNEVVLTGWDGGAVLPGETIRPRGPASSESRGSDRE